MREKVIYLKIVPTIDTI